jgi:hypothetical protein
MPDYRLYHIDKGHFARVDSIEAEDDLKALAEAHRLNGDGQSELWSGDRMIARLRPDRPPDFLS